MTARIMWQCGTNHLGKHVLDVTKQDKVKKKSAEREKIQKAENTCKLQEDQMHWLQLENQ